MPGSGEIIRCAARKEALLRRSESNRAALALSSARLKPTVLLVEQGISFARTAASVWKVAAPLCSQWRAPARESTGWLAKLARAISIGRSFASLMRLRAAPADQKPGSDAAQGAPSQRPPRSG